MFLTTWFLSLCLKVTCLTPTKNKHFTVHNGIHFSPISILDIFKEIQISSDVACATLCEQIEPCCASYNYKTGICMLQQYSCCLQETTPDYNSSVMIRNITHETCEAPWELYKGRCYYFGTEKLNNNKARNECETMRSNLVKIEDQEENDWLKIFANGIKFHTAGSDVMSEGHWLWLPDKCTIQWHDAWIAGEPNNMGGGEHCLVVQSDGKWNDKSCNVVEHFICEK